MSSRQSYTLMPNHPMSRVATVAVAWAAILTNHVLSAPAASGQTFKLLYAFTGGPDGGGPWGTPLFYGGNIYGTTFSGGSPSAHAGTIFGFYPIFNVVDTLHTFGGQPYDGAAAMAGLVADPYGNFWGVSTQGGFLLHGTLFVFGGAPSPWRIISTDKTDRSRRVTCWPMRPEIFGALPAVAAQTLPVPFLCSLRSAASRPFTVSVTTAAMA